MTASLSRASVLILFLAAPILVASAQDAAPSITVANKHYDAAKELPRLTHTYKLTPQEVASIRPILLDQQTKVHELGEDNNLSNSEWSSGVHKIHQQAVLQVKAQLTDAQATAYAKDEDKFSKKSDSATDDGDDGPPFGGPGGGPGGGGGPPPM